MILMQTMKNLKRFSKEWWQNLWFYYKWHMLIGAIVVIAIVTTVVGLNSRVEPDIHVMFAGDFALTAEDQRILTERIQNSITDINGDGQVVARLHIISLSLDKDKHDESTAANNQQLQMQFVTGSQHIYIFDSFNFNRFYNQGLLDPDTLFEFTAENPLFEGTTLSNLDLVMVTREKRLQSEVDFTPSQQLIDCWATPNKQERFQEYEQKYMQ